MNWKYDPVAAKTTIDNEDKSAMVSVAMNKYDEFALHLKQADLEWFEENIVHSHYEPNHSNSK
jgi:hypothetical protein